MMILNKLAFRGFWNGNHPHITEKHARVLLGKGKLVFAQALIGDYARFVRLESLEDLEKLKENVKYFYK